MYAFANIYNIILQINDATTDFNYVGTITLQVHNDETAVMIKLSLQKYTDCVAQDGKGWQGSAI